MSLQFLQIIIDEYGKYISMLLLSFAFVLSGLYIYFINSSVWNTMTRQQNDRDVIILSSNIAALENKYMNIKADLNIDIAKELGYRDDFSKVHFSSENPSARGSISLRGDEI